MFYENTENLWCLHPLSEMLILYDGWFALHGVIHSGWKKADLDKGKVWSIFQHHFLKLHYYGFCYLTQHTLKNNEQKYTFTFRDTLVSRNNVCSHFYFFYGMLISHIIFIPFRKIIYTHINVTALTKEKIANEWPDCTYTRYINIFAHLVQMQATE